MTNWVNIAKPLANLFGSGQSPLPDLSGGWGRLLLLTTLLLLAGSHFAHAQNSSTEPFIDSWQKYRVPVGVSANSVTWELREDDPENPASTLDLSTLDGGGAAWIDIYSENVSETDYAAIEIKFDGDEGFANGQTWYMVYSEWDGTAGSGNCTAVRAFEITISENTFYLSMGDDNDACNSLDGQVLNWNDINSVDIESYVDFTVQMNRQDDFDMNTWSFTGAITFDQSNYDFIRVRSVGNTLPGNSDASEVFTITDDGTGTFTVSVDAETVTPSDPPADYTDFITLRVYVSGLVYEGETVILTVSEGKAFSGANYPKETDDNLSEGGDRIQEQTILPLPATPNIAIVN
jgi:hypothetical protein